VKAERFRFYSYFPPLQIKMYRSCVWIGTSVLGQELSELSTRRGQERGKLGGTEAAAFSHLSSIEKKVLHFFFDNRLLFFKIS
jgi:hypothetical protein